MAVRVAVHQPLPDSTWDNWLDSTPDLSSVNSTQAYCVDVEHQPTDLAVGGSNPSRRAKHAGQSLYPSLIYLHCCGSPVNDLQILTRVVRWIEGSDRPWPASRGCGLQVVAFPELAGVAQLHVGLLVGRVASSDRSAAFQLGVQLRPQQDRGVGQPQPDQEDDHAG